MNLTKLFKNKFFIAILLAIVLVGCLYKYNEYTYILNEKDGKEFEKKNFVYYLKALILSYLVSIVIVILLMKGYDKLMMNNQSNISLETPNLLNENSFGKLSDNLKKQKNNEIFVNSEDSDINNLKKETNVVEERNRELFNDIKELGIDIDTSNFEPVNIMNNSNKQKNDLINKKKNDLINKQKNELKKKQDLLNKRKEKLMEYKKRKLNKEHINTGTPNF